MSFQRFRYVYQRISRQMLNLKLYQPVPVRIMRPKDGLCLRRLAPWY